MVLDLKKSTYAAKNISNTGLLKDRRAPIIKP